MSFVISTYPVFPPNDEDDAPAVVSFVNTRIFKESLNLPFNYIKIHQNYIG